MQASHLIYDITRIKIEISYSLDVTVFWIVIFSTKSGQKIEIKKVKKWSKCGLVKSQIWGPKFQLFGEVSKNILLF